jgi:hypothetical protein
MGNRDVVCVPGNMDMYRKAQANFGKGQSKNIRNVILHSMPKWLVNKVIEEAKNGARDRLQKYIDKNGLAAAQTYALEQLKRYGVTEAQVLEKMGKAEVKGLDLDDLVMLKADLVAIEGGEEYASTLFPSAVAEAKIVDLKDKLRSSLSPEGARQSSAEREQLKAKVDAATTTPAPAHQTLDPEVQVRIGAKPFTWFATDGSSEYLVSQANGVYTCNCKPKCTDCAHVVATQRFATQS